VPTLEDLSMERRPRRVLVTRAVQQAGKLSAGLLAAGFEPVEIPVLEIVPPTSFAPLDKALRELSEFDGLLLTSVNAVRVLEERFSLYDICLTEKKPTIIAVVGDATARAAEKAGLAPTVIPDAFVAESLLASLIASGVANKRFLLPRVESAREILPEKLREAGAIVEIVDAYRNQIPSEAPEALRKALEQGIDVATFTSSSSVTHLRAALHAADLPWPLPKVKAASIGPVTSQTLREAGWEPNAEASPYDIPGLIRAVSDCLSDVY